MSGTPSVAGAFPVSLSITDAAVNSVIVPGQIRVLAVSETGVDTDGDGMPSVWELQQGFNPTSAADASGDADGDGLSNLQEAQWGSDPKKTDSDADGVTDGAEVTAGRNPVVNEAAVIQLLSGERENP